MSYVGKMSELIKLYIAELERDGVEDVLGVGLPVVSGILSDFAQWLEDDVTDLEQGEEEPVNLTSFGDIVESDRADIREIPKALTRDEAYQEQAWADLDAAGIENWDMPSQEELDKAGQLKAQHYIDSLRSRSAWGYLSARAQNEFESKFEEDSDIADS